jgi:hypothetical protein
MIPLHTSFQICAYRPLSRVNADAAAFDDVANLFFTERILWTAGSLLRVPESQQLRLPFRIMLPLNLPPSFYYVGVNSHAHISYSIEVVGQRSGFFHRNRHIRRPFPIVPAATPSQVESKSLLLSGPWKGQWRAVGQEKSIRQGLWGQTALVDALVSFFLVSCPTH